MDNKNVILANPLTLEQLKEMDGQPVFCVSLINGKPGEWCIIRVVEMSKMWFIACAGAAQGFGDKDTYGKTWLAYAYPPIGREAWEPCEYCGEDKKPLAYDNSGDAITIITSSDAAAIESDLIGFLFVSFCPKCGRPLTEQAWAEIEKRIRGEWT